jgi:GNAT superfamily N-acetyltransferase
MLLTSNTYRDAIAKLVDLYAESFKRSIDPGYFHWRYLANPVGEILAVVREEEGGLVANYSASPVRMSVHSETVRAGLSMTTMTHPDHAGKGLFTKLAVELYAHMQEAGYALVWGFPNHQSHRGFISRLAWHDVYEIPTMRLALSSSRLADVTIETDDAFALEYALAAPIKDGVFVLKDAPYLQWRYARNPVNAYTNLVVHDAGVVTSCCVVKTFGTSLDIIDFQASDAEQGAYLLQAALRLAQERGLESINCWAPRHHVIHPLCEKLGFTLHAPITYLGARPLAALASGRAVSMCYDDWYLQMGDSDVY